MNKEHYKLYENKEYMKALNVLLERSVFDLTADHNIPEDFIEGYVDYFKEQVNKNANNIDASNSLIFIEKCLYIMGNNEYTIFDYYSEAYKKNFYISWDTEATCEVLYGNCVSMFDNYIFDGILKPTRLNFIRKCKALGFKYDRSDFEAEQYNSSQPLYTRLYSKKTLKDDPYLCAVLWD